MEIKTKTEQPALARTGVTASMAYEGATPSNDTVAKDLASLLKVDASLVVVKRIATVFGAMQAHVSAVVYKDAAAKARYEVKTKRIKDLEAKAAQEAAAKSSKVEAPQTGAPQAEAPKEAA